MKGRDIQQELKDRGIIVRASGGWSSLAEEAYKDVSEVVEVCHGAGLCSNGPHAAHWSDQGFNVSARVAMSRRPGSGLNVVRPACRVLQEPKEVRL